MPKPNIVFIMCDSMDGRAMGCMGQGVAHTPNLDSVRARVLAWIRTVSSMKPNYIPKASVIDMDENREHSQRDWGRLRDFLSGVESQVASGKMRSPSIR